MGDEEPSSQADPMRSGKSMRRPVNAPTCGDFGGRRKNGQPCCQFVVAGTKRCRMHGGKKLAVQKAEGAVVLELRRWGLGDTKVDPGEVLLRLVSQSAARVEMYGQALAEAYAAAERMRTASDAARLVGAPDGVPSAAELVARADLDRIFLTGGVAALVGHTYTATQAGGIYATGEAIRGLAQLEAQERDRCASFCAKAIAAGLAERQVRLAEKQGAQIAAVLRLVFGELVLSPEQQLRVPALLELAAVQLGLAA